MTLDYKFLSADGLAQTCIALRTMLVKDGIAYLQAGVGFLQRLDVGRCADQPQPGWYRLRL